MTEPGNFADLTTSSRDEAFSHYRRCVRLLLERLPGVQDALLSQGEPCVLAGWQAMEVRFEAFEQQNASPVLVATLYGPSGAGKSAWFRRLTGIQVPSGDVMRPMTFACAMAVPDSLCRPDRLEGLFPGFALAPLDDVDQLRNADAEDHRLLYVNYAPQAATHPLPLVLVDVPDFNTVEQANWEKAEQVLDRAEMVVFVVFGDAYKDDRVVRELARCCRKAGFLAYLFTKTTPEAAKVKWRDLLETAPRFDFFQDRRNDGRSLHEFLAGCDAYSSPFSADPQMSEITPVNASSPDFDSLLHGQDAVRIVLTGLLESTSEAVTSCREVLATANLKRETLEQALQDVGQECQRSANKIAASQFPAGRLLELAIDVSRKNLHWSARIVSYPIALFERKFKPAISGLQGWLSPNSDDKNVHQRDDFERDRLTQSTESLIDRFRSLFPDQASPERMLDVERCGKIRDGFFSQALPEPSDDWETVVRNALEQWCQANRWRSHMLAISSDVMLAAGATAIVIDIAMTGGIIGTFGSATAAGAGSVAASRALERFGSLELRKVAEQAYDCWREQRRQELAAHLQQHFSDRLFEPWSQCLEQLDETKIQQCTEACRELSGLAKELGVAP